MFYLTSLFPSMLDSGIQSHVKCQDRQVIVDHMDYSML